jgi:hypothetical protein
VVTLDGGTFAYRFCGRGVGVTGYDERDCRKLIGDLLAPEQIPRVVRADRDVDVSRLPIALAEIGVSVWRGIWFPRTNLRGPDTGL